MTEVPQFGNNLTLAEKCSRLRVRLRTQEWRRYGKLLFAGKLAGVALVLLVMAAMSYLAFGRVYAAEGEVKAADVINPVNTAWTLIAEGSLRTEERVVMYFPEFGANGKEAINKALEIKPDVAV